MATSGSKSVKVTNWDTLKFSWSESSQSIANNTTTITWKMQLVATSDGYIASSVAKDWSVTVNGTKYSGTNKVGISNNSTKTLASGTTVIKHNSDGTKSFDYSFSQEFNITFSGSNIGTISGSGSGTLDTIPRASSLTAGNGTLDTEQTLTINRASSSFKHRITYTCGSASGYAAGSSTTFTTATSISWTPPLSLASQNKTGTSVSIKFTLHTYNSGGTKIGTATKTISCGIPASVKPTVSLTVTDSTGYADTYGNPVKGLSKFKVVVTPTTSYGSAIASYKTTANGSTYTASSFTTGALKSSGTLKVSTTVKDKRGRTASASVSKTVLDYAVPVIDGVVVRRCDEDGTINQQGAFGQVYIFGDVTPLNNKNTATYTLKYKKTTDVEWTSVVLTDLQDVYSVSAVGYIFPADTGASYDVDVVLVDNHNTTHRSTTLSTAFTILHFGANGTSMGVGKIAEHENSAEFGVDIYDKFGDIIRNGVPRYEGTANPIDPNTTTDHLILTNLNTPDSKWCFVYTVFYQEKTNTTSFVQYSLPYAYHSEIDERLSIYHRVRHNGVISPWRRCVNADEIIDTDWIDLSMSSNFKCYSDITRYKPQCKRSGNVVTVRGMVTPTVEFDSSESTIIASGIPEDCRPSYAQYFRCQGSGVKTWRCEIMSDGAVRVSRYGIDSQETVSTSAFLAFCVTYQI